MGFCTGARWQSRVLMVPGSSSAGRRSPGLPCCPPAPPPSHTDKGDGGERLPSFSEDSGIEVYPPQYEFCQAALPLGGEASSHSLAFGPLSLLATPRLTQANLLQRGSLGLPCPGMPNARKHRHSKWPHTAVSSTPAACVGSLSPGVLDTHEVNEATGPASAREPAACGGAGPAEECLAGYRGALDAWPRRMTCRLPPGGAFEAPPHLSRPTPGPSFPPLSRAPPASDRACLAGPPGPAPPPPRPARPGLALPAATPAGPKALAVPSVQPASACWDKALDPCPIPVVLSTAGPGQKGFLQEEAVGPERQARQLLLTPGPDSTPKPASFRSSSSFLLSSFIESLGSPALDPPNMEQKPSGAHGMFPGPKDTGKWHLAWAMEDEHELPRREGLESRGTSLCSDARQTAQVSPPGPAVGKDVPLPARLRATTTPMAVKQGCNPAPCAPPEPEVPMDPALQTLT
ncbi:PREDICTED: vegetative cell wall protein gp1-like [Galeopterus variegatus]|uniref:Vegetative cell wall protein gp1-like n=1 Tax=Galeopterus variegatus TaxID=482537 RepID=A0ABM0R2P0_GALVR|nr:PREDICTED: vegetative cell wall protein gp1-like [Galeopterus variegatus]